ASFTKLEHEAQRKLNVPLSIRLRGRDVAEQRVAQVHIQTTIALVAPLRRIRKIEGFRPELHLEALRERKIFEQREIHASLPWIVVTLNAKVPRRAESKWRSCAEGHDAVQRLVAREIEVIRLLVRIQTDRFPHLAPF